jgi:mannobiose 2-epimerase
MQQPSCLTDLRCRVEVELLSDILPFWLKHSIDQIYGGFVGQIANDLAIDPHAHKGLILNARILWTFSRAFAIYREDAYLQAAHRAADYIARHFWDAQFNGFFWMVDYLGRPVDTKKRIYGQAFVIYALVEYHRATRDTSALEKAICLYGAVETAAHDERNQGYFETYERDWSLAQDQRLSGKDMDEKKSMNTHLHLLEAYAALLRVWNNADLRTRLQELLHIFLHRIINPSTQHFWTFFDEEWQPRSDHISFGHDIEGSWLICEAAEIVGDAELRHTAEQQAIRMAQAVYAEGIDADGGLLHEADPNGIIDGNKHWWPQAEAVVGFLNAYQISGQEHFLQAAQKSWEFIDKYIIDHRRGEWFWRVSRDGVPSDDERKVDPWKCPYHNSRACLEAMARIDHILETAT